MNSVRCPKGHFYDFDKYGGSCPHCLIMQNKQTDNPTVPVEDAAVMTDNDEKIQRKKTISLEKAIKMSEEDDEPTVSDTGYTPLISSPQYSPVQLQKNVRPSEYMAPAYNPPENDTGYHPDEEKTVSMFYTQDYVMPEPASAYHPPASPSPAAPPYTPEEYIPAVTKKPSLNELFKTSADDDNKTVSIGGLGDLTEPTVGWLLGVNGDYYGECFELKSGRNFIGRSTSMDIVLELDRAVSRNKHAIIIYEPHSRAFFAQPGESRELFYINDNVVLKNEPIKPYDILLIGNTKLLFFPLCGKKFSWEDLKK